MKKSVVIIVLALLASDLAWCQYRPYHHEDLQKHKKKKVKSFSIHQIEYGYGMGTYYKPQKFQGLQVVSVNRAGGTFDDVYFIDKNGNTQYHTIRPTAPLNTSPHGPANYDSFNPTGYRYESIGQAIIGGVGSLLTGFIK
ncbi:MAG: hypothetical protein ABJF11_07425 [Reichenbachiella sp.]|uniref:hypothetical protein n=1 Tax=Reichenbachiella sp. TaxID=2184521 RepID=UPI0032679CE9